MVSFHLSTICYQVGSFFFFILFVFSSNLDIKTSTPCGLCDVSKCHAERSPTVLPTTRFFPERYVGRLWGASNKGWFAHLRLLTTEFVKTSRDLSRRENAQWDLRVPYISHFFSRIILSLLDRKTFDDVTNNHFSWIVCTFGLAKTEKPLL
uniref:Uncharacterized protein n=1 Tax=Ixodes ricinus TaxID=34613 RepID=A0A147BEQ5_IXORI